MSVPSGIEIAEWFVSKFPHTDAYHGSEPLSLGDAGHLWVTAVVDADEQAYYLLDVTTTCDGVTTGDFLYVSTGVLGLRVQWRNRPLASQASASDHRVRHFGGLQWFVDLIQVDSGADPEPQRVIVDFAEVEPQHSPLRTWPTDPETAP